MSRFRLPFRIFFSFTHFSTWLCRTVQKQEKYLKEFQDHLQKCKTSTDNGQQPMSSALMEHLKTLKEENWRVTNLVTQYQERVHTVELKVVFVLFCRIAFFERC